MMDEIKELDEEIASLPKGYISKKKINGKIRYYRQWVEDKKIKSKYISEKDFESVSAAIARRKELEEKRKELKKNVSTASEIFCEMDVLYGERLNSYCSLVRDFLERDCCKNIRTYLYGKVTPRVCVVYGLRRTGKTTMLLQMISQMTSENFAKAVYIKARSNQSMSMLDRDLKKLYNAGFRYVFIDEVTFLDDFVDTASFLSDIYAAIGMKIVLSGTDSLGFWFADREELYDRTYTIHTTWISFAEHARLLGITDIDEYIRYGGTLRVGETDFDDPELKNENVSFRDDETTRRYIDTAICQNIQHSLKCYESGEHFRNLRELYANNELTGAINRVIESMNHRFLLDVLTRNFKSNDLALAKKNMLREKDPEKRTDILDRIDLQAVTERLMEILNIRNTEMMKTTLTESHVAEIKEYLKALELIDTYTSRFINGGYEEHVIITQPGMRFVQAQALVYSLLKDTAFESLDNASRNYICDKILDEVKGRMMEEIVLLETIRKSKNADICKLIFDAGEFDMVIYHRENNSCDIFEIKHSTERSSEQTKHICNEEKCRLTEEKFGKIKNKAVIYRGESASSESGVQYINVSEYLTELGR